VGAIVVGSIESSRSKGPTGEEGVEDDSAGSGAKRVCLGFGAAKGL